jgi:hypothetical protein
MRFYKCDCYGYTIFDVMLFAGSLARRRNLLSVRIYHRAVFVDILMRASGREGATWTVRRKRKERLWCLSLGDTGE